MMAVMMVFLAGRLPARAAETYTITLYGNGGYCIDDAGKKQDSIALDVSAGTVLTTDDNCGDVSWQSSDPNLGFAGWTDAAGAEYGSSDTFTVNGNAELYAIWDSLVDEKALAAATASNEQENNNSEAPAANEATSDESATDESSSGESAAGTAAADESEASESESEASAPMMLAAAPSNQKTITITIDGGNGGYYIDANGAQQTSLVLQHTMNLDANGNPTDMGLQLEISDRLGGVEWLNSDPHNRMSTWNISGSLYSIYNSEVYSAEQDETITAEWETCNLITFDSGSATAYFEYNEATPATVTVKCLADESLGGYVGDPINTDTAKVLYGWDYDGDGISDSNDYSRDKPTGDMTITAIWADRITITFDPQGGSYYVPNGFETSPFVYEGSSANWYSLASVKPYLHHSTSALAGWAYDQAGSSMVTDDVTYTDVNGKTLYAVWAKDVYTLTYDANGGAFTGTVSGTQAYDRIPATETWPTAQVTTDGHEDPERSGYEFGGWAMDPDGKEQFRSVWGEASRNASMPETGDFTVYAIWKNLSEKTDSTGLWIYQELGNGNAEIIDYLGTDTDLVIPDTVDGLTVTRLKLSEMGTGVHNNTVDITSLVIPDTVQSFSDMTGGMFGRTSLQSVTFGSGIKEIPTNMFRDCTSLSQVVLPENLEYIGAWAFQNTAITSIDLPASCKELAWRVFYGCASLEEVTIRGNLNYFGGEQFINTGLKTIRFMADLPVNGDANDPASFTGITATAYYPAYWTSVPSSTYQGATNITWVREATAKVMQIDHQTEVPDQVLVNGTALTASQYVATVTQDADGKDIVIIELTEAYKSTLADDAKIEAVYASETFEGTVYPENVSYATLDIENGSQTVEGEATADSLKPVVITVSGQAANVQSVGVDGTILDQKAYTVTAGSAIITLLEDYLATLPADENEHEVTVTFKDGGIATASFTVVTTAPEEQPEPSEDESSAEESSPEESAAEESNTEESSAEESSSEESSAEESAAEESKTEESKAEESKAEESSSSKPAPVIPSDSPNTGDPGYLIWVIAIAASGVVLALLLVFLLKKRRK